MYEMLGGFPKWKRNLGQMLVIWMTQGSAVDGAMSFNGCEKRVCAIPGQVYVCG